MVLQRVVHTNPPTSRANDYKNFLRDSLKTIIKNNHFSFGEGFFKQTRGVAMGTKCAPPFANLFLASLEERALGTWKGPAPTAWLRFLDDVLMLWNGGLEQLERFLSHLNGQMSTINFTLEHSQERAVFLDLHIYKGDRFRATGVLDTKIHNKATNPQWFLHFTSCHPQHIFRNIIRGEVLRELRCSSDQQVFTMAVLQLKEKFLSRGYPERVFRQASDDVLFEHREQHLVSHPKQQLTPETTIFCATHHPALDSTRIWQILMDEETPFTPKVIRGRPKSHGDLLVRAKTRSTTTTAPAYTPVSAPASASAYSISRPDSSLH